MRFQILILFLLLLPLEVRAQAILKKGYKEILIKEKNKLTYKKVRPGSQIFEGTKIKTGPEDVSLILFPNNVKCYMRGNTIIQLTKIGSDMKLELIKGTISIISRNYKSRTHIKTLIADIRFEFGECLIKNISNNVFISIFDNEVTVSSRDKEIIVRQGYGLELAPDTGYLETFPLPNPSVPKHPEDKSIITGGVDLQWSKISEAILFRIEIAKDKDFIQIAKTAEVNKNSFPTGDLDDGKYYWKVSSINRKNIEGVFFEYNNFIIQQSRSSLVIKKKKKGKVSDLSSDDEEVIDDGEIPADNAGNTIILGSVILVSLIVLIIF